MRGPEGAEIAGEAEDAHVGDAVVGEETTDCPSRMLAVFQLYVVEF